MATTTMMADPTIARTILEQLGGPRFRAFTGARNLTSHADGLSFRLPGGGGFCVGGINHVRIVLTAADTYNLTFTRIRGTKATVVDEATDIYAEQLRQVFSRATGLVVSLGSGMVTSVGPRIPKMAFQNKAED